MVIPVSAVRAANRRPNSETHLDPTAANGVLGLARASVTAQAGMATRRTEDGGHFGLGHINGISTIAYDFGSKAKQPD